MSHRAAGAKATPGSLLEVLNLRFTPGLLNQHFIKIIRLYLCTDRIWESWTRGWRVNVWMKMHLGLEKPPRRTQLHTDDWMCKNKWMRSPRSLLKYKEVEKWARCRRQKRKIEHVINKVTFYETLYPIFIITVLYFDVRGSYSPFPSIICIHYSHSCLQAGLKAEIFLFWYLIVSAHSWCSINVCIVKEESLFNEKSMLANQKKIDSIVNPTWSCPGYLWQII